MTMTAKNAKSTNIVIQEHKQPSVLIVNQDVEVQKVLLRVADVMSVK
jgi:hypothetical protein